MTKIILPLLILCVALLDPKAALAAIGTPTALTGAISTSSGKTIAISTPAISTGNTIIVTVSAESSNPGSITVTDTKGNTYTPNGGSTNSTSPFVDTYIFSAPVTTALISGNTITVTFGNNVTDKDANAFYVSGLLSASPVDQTAGGSGGSTTSTTATAGPTGTTSQPTELLVGAIAMASAPNSATAGTGYSAIGAFLNTPGSVGLLSEYQIVSATGTYSATGTWTPAQLWSASIATYKATAGTATQLVIANSPVTVTAGVASGTITVQRQDQYGNPNTTDASRTVTLSSTSTGTVTFNPTSLTIASGSSSATFTYTDTQAGTPTITAASTSPTTITSATQQETVNPAAANTLTMTQQPSSTATAGTAFAQQPTVTVKDQYGNLVADGTTVTATETSGGNLNGTTTAQTATTTSGVATFSGLYVTNAATVTLTFTANSHTVASSSIVVSPAAASTLTMTQQPSTTATAGTVFATQPKVTVKDAYGNLVSNGTTVTATETSGGNLNGTTTATTTSGVATFSGLYVTNSGTVTLTFSANGNNVVSGNITVSAASATQLSVTQEPATTATAGTAFTTQPKVTVLDTYGNTVTTYATAITAAETSGGNLNATTTAQTATPSSGVATFSGLYVTNAASSVTITFTSGSLTSAISTGIDVSPAAANTLTMTQQPSTTATAGTAFATQPEVTVKDAYGNLVSNGTTVTATETTGGNLNGTTTAQTATTTSGLATFTGLYVTNAATVTLTFTANTHTVVSGSIVVSPAAANTLTMTQQPSTSATAGTVFATQPKVTVKDAYGNLVSNGTTVTATETSGGNLNGTTTAQTATTTTGLATFSGLYVTNAGTETLTFTANGNNVVSGNITVSAATASSIVFVQGPPASVTDTVAMSPAVTVEVTDTYGNPIGGASVTMSLNSGTGTLTGGGAQTTVTGTGIATFSALSVNLIGSKTLKATVASPSLSVVSGSFTVVLGPIASYSVAATTPQARGTAFNVTVTALDAGGNTVTTDNSTVVTMSASSANVQFTGNPMTLSSGTFTISTLDDVFETVTITATDGNSKTGNTSVTINPVSGDYQSRATGNWSSSGTWSTWSGSAWVNASSAPTSSTTGEICVTNANTVTVTASVTAQYFVLNAGGTVSINSGETLTVENGLAYGVISGSGILAESGAGNMLTMTGANTYSGGTTITGGTVSVTNVTTSGNQNLGTGGITFANGGTLENAGSGAQSTAVAVTINSGGGVISMTGPNTMEFTGTVSGGGGLATGGNDLILDRASGNNAIGPIIVNSGRLFVFTTNSIASSSITVESAATVDFSTGGSTTPNNTMTFASGACLANRTGTLTVSTANVSFPTSGTMVFNQDDQVSTNITINGAYPTLTGPLTIQVGSINAAVGTVTLTGAISGSGGLTKTGTGILILDSANSYTGGTTVSSGPLTAEVTGSLGSGAVSIASGATMTLANGTTETVAALYLNGVREAAGSYGSTASSASNKNSTYFGTTATGILNASAGAASQLIITLPGQTYTSGSGNSGTIGSQTAGTSFNITLTAADSSKNIDTTYSGSQTVSYSGPSNAPDGATPTYITTVTFTSGQVTGVATTLVDAQTTTITPSLSGLTSVASSNLTIVASPASVLVFVTSPVTVTAGVASSSITVQRQDQYGNTNTTDASRTVTLSSTSTGTKTFTPSSLTIANGSGSASFTYTDTKAGTPTITAASTSPTTITSATQQETVNPGTLDHFAMSSISSPQTAGTAFTITTITAQDVYNNTVTSYVTTVTFGGTAGVTGTSGSFTAGVLNNASVTATVAGSSLTVTVTDGAGHTGSATIATVNPGPANAYRITAATTNVYPGTADALTVKLVDHYGNTVNYTGNTNLTFSGLNPAGNGTQPTVSNDTNGAVALGTATTITFTSGQSSAGGSLLAYKAESQILEAKDNATIPLSTTNTGGAGVSLTISNVAPVANSYSFTRAQGLDLIISVSSLMASNTDANDDTLTFSGLLSSTSAQGGTLISSPPYVFYIANSATNGDTFSYSITNSTGLSATGLVTILVVTPGGMLQNVAYSNGAATVTCAGIPGEQYYLERSTNLVTWTNIATITAPSAGVFSYTDNPAPSPSAYYELVQDP